MALPAQPDPHLARAQRLHEPPGLLVLPLRPDHLDQLDVP